MTFDSIVNRAEFFSDHYLDARLTTDLQDLRRAWDAAEGRDRPTARTGLRTAARPFFKARAAVAEASVATRTDAVRALNDVVLSALGFAPERGKVIFDRSGGTDELAVPVAAKVETATGPLLIAVDAGAASEVDELFDTDTREEGKPPGYLLESATRDGGKVEVANVADVPGEVFSVDDPPRFVLLCGGSTLMLAERSKWPEGRFLAVELDAALERLDTKAKGELESIAALFSADALVPGHLAGEDEPGTSFFDEVDDRQNKHAVGVSKELREGMRRSVEILATEVIKQRSAKRMAVYGPNGVDPTDLTRQCLRYLYRLIVLLYAESRPELGVVPTDDDAYLAGYSLDRLRELMLVDLDDEHARSGTHIDESLRLLFRLVNDGYHASEAQQAFVFDTDTPDATRSTEDYLQFPGLDATIFDPGSTPLLDSVPLRNEALQRVLVLLMLNRESKRKSDQRGFISYAQLGINQLGAVYEGLMAYTGFFAREDLYEVAKSGDPKDGTWMVPVTAADDYPDEVFVRETDPISGRVDRVRHARGSFVYRLAGRDRQRSASYYTPEVLTSCVVRHALAELLGTDDYARIPGGSAGITEARQILDLTICEPALGSGAFLNEAINQLSAEYLKRRQAELGETLDAETYQRELQRVKAHFALHQCYGVDLNATAVELAEVSLWLNCMYPGLKAPWFGLRLRRGNSLVGCRRATWPAKRLRDKVWAKEKASDAVPPTDRPLSEPLAPDEIHHFLLPGHGWGAAAGRKEAKELASDRAKALSEWRRAILKAPTPADADRLAALAAGVENLWAEATDVLTRLDQRMRRPLVLYGQDVGSGGSDDDRRAAEKILNNPESALGRLRLVMNAWIGLWFWPLDSDVMAPSWRHWLATLERIVDVEPTVPAGQLDLFADLAAIEAIEAERAAVRESVASVLSETPWLRCAVDLALKEGAWHWPVEFAPIFARGGFSLQVGNPPWVRPIWEDEVVLAEIDPWFGFATDRVTADRRRRLLSEQSARAGYLAEVASASGLADFLGSPSLHPILQGVQTNVYMSFIDAVWRHQSVRGSIGLLHPEGHFSEARGGDLRRRSYRCLRRLWHFVNEALLFEDVGHTREYGVHIYGRQDEASFMLCSGLHRPDTVDGSLEHDGSGAVPAKKFNDGSWDRRPHRDRVVRVSEETIATFAGVSGGGETDVLQARLLFPYVRSEVAVLERFGSGTQKIRQSDPAIWTGLRESDSVNAGILVRQTTRPSIWAQVVLQNPHIDVACPVASEPRPVCLSHHDYDPVDLIDMPINYVPRTNYQPGPEWDSGVAAAMRSLGSEADWKIVHRRRVDPDASRALRAVVVPFETQHVNTMNSVVFRSTRTMLRVAGLLSSLPYEYPLKISGRGDFTEAQLQVLPLPAESLYDLPLLLRVLRLNALTFAYAGLWTRMFDREWNRDRWTTDSPLPLEQVGDVDGEWSPMSPLRTDLARRQALVEIDALVALMLDLNIEDLCASYRTQFAVLRKHEFETVFDSDGRRIAHDKNARGTSQEPGDWDAVQAWLAAPGSVEVRGYTPPFTRPDREAEMTRAYNEFRRRLDAGEYG